MDKDQHDLFFCIDQDPYHHVIDLFCNRWKPYILRALDFDQTTRFSTFTRQLPISERVLGRNLRELEEDGLISRTVHADEMPVRVEYALTEIGKSLIPLLDAMYDWGWQDMRRKGLPIDPLGEMWHGYRERDEALMQAPYKKK